MDLQSGALFELLELLLPVLLENVALNDDPCAPLSQLLVRHEQMLLSRVRQHIHEVLAEPLPCKPTSDSTLNLDGLLLPFPCFDPDQVPLSEASEDRLDHYCWTIPFKDAFKSVDIDFQIEQMLLSRLLPRILRDVEFHVFVEGSEAISEGSILDSFLVSDHVVVKRQQALERVDHEVSVARHSAHGVRV